jgi:hypothetical protein
MKRLQKLPFNSLDYPNASHCSMKADFPEETARRGVKCLYNDKPSRTFLNAKSGNNLNVISVSVIEKSQEVTQAESIQRQLPECRHGESLHLFRRAPAALRPTRQTQHLKGCNGPASFEFP